jgi:hypothetical protein
MTDLYVGIAIVCILSAALGWAGYALTRRASALAVLGVVAAVLGLVSVLRSDPDRLWLAGWLPFSNLIVLGNPTLPAAALVSGIIVRRIGGIRLRSLILLVPLLSLAAFDLVRPLLGHPPALGDQWTDGECRQTSAESCSPAAAATLLSAHGIDASEAGMARLCLTGADGTLAAGVYRGLTIMSRPHGLRPRPFHGNIDDLKRMGGPVLITVELRRGQHADPRYQTEWGWIPGVSHSVVLLQFLPNGRVEIADPAEGRETWDIEALRVLWHGDGIRLE